MCGHATWQAAAVPAPPLSPRPRHRTQGRLETRDAEAAALNTDVRRRRVRPSQGWFRAVPTFREVKSASCVSSLCSERQFPGASGWLCTPAQATSADGHLRDLASWAARSAGNAQPQAVSLGAVGCTCRRAPVPSGKAEQDTREEGGRGDCPRSPPACAPGTAWPWSTWWERGGVVRSPGLLGSLPLLPPLTEQTAGRRPLLPCQSSEHMGSYAARHERTGRWHPDSRRGARARSRACVRAEQCFPGSALL